MKKLSDRLTNLRESKGWTKTYVAKRLGIKTLSTYANYEYDLREPDMDTLSKIADLYDTTVDELVGRETQSVYGRDVNLDELTENQRTVLDWAMQQEALSFHSKEELSKILDNLALIMEYEKSKSKSNGNTKS